MVAKKKEIKKEKEKREKMTGVGHSGTFKAGNGTTDRCLMGDSYP